jgi:hypothetical protein
MSDGVNESSGSGRHHKSGIVDFFEISMVIIFSVFSGFILGLLFAPQSGLKTRSKIGENLRNTADRLKFMLAEARVAGEEFLDRSVQKISGMSSAIEGEEEEDDG